MKNTENARNVLKESLKSLQILSKNFDFKEFGRLLDVLKKNEGKIVTTGVGKSALIARKMSATLSSFDIESCLVHPTEALHGDSGIVKQRDIIIAFSYSGESAEVIRFCKHEIQNKKIDVFSITGRKDSALGVLSKGVFQVFSSKEGSPKNLAPMASLVVSLVVADMIAAELAIDLDEEKFSKLHPAGLLGLKFKTVSEKMSSGENIPLVSLQSSFKQALVESTEKKKGIVGVVDKNKIVQGVITDGDIRRLCIKESNLENVSLRSVMTKNPITIGCNQSLLDALRIMEMKKITNVFVVDDKKRVVGIIHMHDVLGSNLF